MISYKAVDFIITMRMISYPHTNYDDRDADTIMIVVIMIMMMTMKVKVG
jgi:hypothetical protein